MPVLVLFASIEGQTRKIARFVETELKRAGVDVTVVDASEKMAEVTFEGFDTVILAAPVHERRHPPNFELLLAASRADLAAHCPPQGESFADVCARVRPALQEIAAQGDAVIVAHAGVIRAGLALAMDSVPQALAFEIAPLSLTELHWLGAHGWSVVCVNWRA